MKQSFVFLFHSCLLYTQTISWSRKKVTATVALLLGEERAEMACDLLDHVLWAYVNCKLLLVVEDSFKKSLTQATCAGKQWEMTIFWVQHPRTFPYFSQEKHVTVYQNDHELGW